MTPRVFMLDATPCTKRTRDAQPDDYSDDQRAIAPPAPSKPWQQNRFPFSPEPGEQAHLAHSSHIARHIKSSCGDPGARMACDAAAYYQSAIPHSRSFPL